MELPQVGELFDDRYQLEGVLGQGGMGCVFRAFDQTDRRHVAVKVVRPDEQGYAAGIEARFRREVEIVANLRSPHTVTMYSSGRDEHGRLYMVFELVPGADLASIIQQAGRLDAATTRHILEQVLRALHEAHDKGLLHRDVKPDNIRVHEQHGDVIEVKLLDFGIARAAKPTDRLTQTGELIGTPRYMSPEQLREQSLTPASDIYSLGVVGFEMLMGSQSLQGAGWTDQVDRLMTGHVFSIPEIERVGPLAKVISKMCAREPRDRYPSAAAVLADLSSLDGRPSLPTMRAEASPRRTTTARRLAATIPAWMWAALAVVVGVLIYLVYQIGFAEDASQRPVVASDPSAILNVPTPAGPAVAARPIDAADAAFASDTGTADLADMEELSGCGQPSPFAGTAALGRWMVHVPRNYDPEREHPLIVLFHQDAQTPTGIIAETELDQLADREGIVVLAPSGGTIAFSNPETHTEAVAGLKLVKARLCIDNSRVYAVGHGPGGQAAVRMPCLSPGFAAVATTSHGIIRGSPLCDSYEDIATIQLRPLKDGNVQPEGGPGCSFTDKVSLAEQEQLFVEANGCRGDRRVRSRHKRSVCYEWTCDAPFVSCHLDGGRGWPGLTEPRRLDLLDCDGEPTDFPYARTIWEFFEQVSTTRERGR